MGFGNFSGNLHIIPLELTHQRMRKMEKIPSSSLQRGSKADVILGLLASKTDEQDARGQEEGEDESGGLLCFTGRKGHWMNNAHHYYQC